MKKLASVTGLALFAAGAFAQGTINFVNSPSTLVITNNSGPVQSSMNPRVVLYYRTAVSAPALPSQFNGYSFAGWTQTTPTTPDSAGVPLVGIFSGGTQTAATAAGGSSPWVFVAGWTGGHADFVTAIGSGSSLFGISQNAWQQPTGNPGGAPPTSPVNLVLGPTAFNGLNLGIPEPSALALAGLGAVALLVFRRRK